MAKRSNASYHDEGHVREYETKAGARWSYIIRVPKDPDRPELGTKYAESGGHLSEGAAYDAKAKALRERDRGLRVGSKTPTLQEFGEQWLNSLALSESTVGGYRRQLTRHVFPRIGDKPIDQIKTTTLNELYKTMETEPPLNVAETGRWSKADPLGANSISKIATTLGALFDAAVDDHHILDNPGKGRRVKKPPKSKIVEQAPTMVVWNQQQMTAFLVWLRDTRQDSDYTLWKMYAATGARRSEILALRWSDIDFKNCRVHIRRTLNVDKPGHTKKPKNGKSRDFAVSESTIAALREWRKTLMALRGLNLAHGSAWVFPMVGDWERHRNPQSTSQMFQRRVEWAQKDLGVEALPTIHLHEVRHSVATILISEGTDPKTVSERLGHESVRITLDIYTHVTKKSDDAAAALLDFG